MSEEIDAKNTTKKPAASSENEAERAKREGNTCIALGLGVGSLGAAVGLAAGAVCPLCVVVAPSLVGIGVIRRLSGKIRRGKN